MSQGQLYEVVAPAAPPIEELPEGGVRQQFMAWLPQGIAGPKVAGFVAEQKARVLRVRPDELRLRIGQPQGWLRGSESEDDFAVELVIQLNRETQCVRSMTHVIVDLRPLANRVEEEARRQRLKKLVCALRYRLLALELELA